MKSSSRQQRPDRFYSSLGSDCSIWQIYAVVIDHAGMGAPEETEGDRHELKLETWSRLATRQYYSRGPENCAEVL